MRKRTIELADGDPGEVRTRSLACASTPHASPGSCVVGIAALSFVFLYVNFIVQPAIEYFHAGRPFFLTLSYLDSFLGQPGGLLGYGVAFLDALSYSNWSGAAVFAALVGLAMIGFRSFVVAVAGFPPRALVLVLPFLLLFLRQQPSAAATLVGCGVVVALSSDRFLGGLPLRCSRVRNAIDLVAGAGLACIAGPWPGLLFCLLGGVHAISRKETLWTPLARLAGTACVVGLVQSAFLAHPPQSLLPSGGVLGVATYLSVPFLGLGLFFGRKYLRPSVGAGSTRSGEPRDGFLRILRHWTTTAALALVLGLSLWRNRDPEFLARAQIDYYAHLGSDAKVVEVARTLPRLDPSSELRLHLALCHLGRLNEDLFDFDNCRLPTVLPGLAAGVETCRAQSEALFELGQVSVAEHFAHEALEWEGNRPDILLCLARVNELKGRPKAAKVFLRVLGQIPRERESAMRRLARLDAGGAGMDEAQMALVRGRMPTTDLPHDEPPAEPLLRQLLHANNQNRMAFEYLMAQYLLSLDLDRLTANLPLLERLGYRVIPRHIEEGVLLWEKFHGTKPNLGRLTIRPETERRFKAITEALGRREHENPEGRKALKAAFGDTFWLYYVMNQGLKQAASGAQP